MGLIGGMREGRRVWGGANIRLEGTAQPALGTGRRDSDSTYGACPREGIGMRSREGDLV